MSGLVAKLNAGDVYNVDILLEYSEDDLAGLGLQRPFARKLLRKAKEMSEQSALNTASMQQDHGVLLISMDEYYDTASAHRSKPQSVDEIAPMLLISTSITD